MAVGQEDKGGCLAEGSFVFFLFFLFFGGEGGGSAFSGNFCVSKELARIAPNSQAIAGLGAGGSWNERALPTAREQRMCPFRGTDASN